MLCLWSTSAQWGAHQALPQGVRSRVVRRLKRTHHARRVRFKFATIRSLCTVFGAVNRTLSSADPSPVGAAQSS
eukprot:1681260-Prymnesium_polylepis.1